MTIGTEAAGTAQGPIERFETRGAKIELSHLMFSVMDDGQERLILDDVSLTIEPGEFVVLIGRSGCGKTTVLNTLSGLVSNQSGMARINGEPVQSMNVSVGYMFARDALMPWRTAERNVELGLEISKVSKSERRERARVMLERVQLSHAATRFPWQLSQGMRQRVALARTWVTDPSVLLMDEPFAALDAQTRTSVSDEFMEIWSKDRKTVVFVTHDLTEALLLADRIVVMGEGRILEEFSLNFPRPRQLEDLEGLEEFRSLQRTLHGLLDAPANPQP